MKNCLVSIRKNGANSSERSVCPTGLMLDHELKKLLLHGNAMRKGVVFSMHSLCRVITAAGRIPQGDGNSF